MEASSCKDWTGLAERYVYNANKLVCDFWHEGGKLQTEEASPQIWFLLTLKQLSTYTEGKNQSPELTIVTISQIVQLLEENKWYSNSNSKSRQRTGEGKY